MTVIKATTLTAATVLALGLTACAGPEQDFGVGRDTYASPPPQAAEDQERAEESQASAQERELLFMPEGQPVG